MENQNSRQNSDIRFEIDGQNIIDKHKVINDGKAIYIREVLDSLSHEFNKSVLNKEDRLIIIGSIGMNVLTQLLRDCFNKKEGCDYDAYKEALFTLHSLLKMPYPTLTYVQLEND